MQVNIFLYAAKGPGVMFFHASVLTVHYSRMSLGTIAEQCTSREHDNYIPVRHQYVTDHKLA